MENFLQLRKWSRLSSERKSTAAPEQSVGTERLNIEATGADLKKLIEDNVSYMKQVSELLGEIALSVIEGNE